jgi:hypothetical protein
MDDLNLKKMSNGLMDFRPVSLAVGPAPIS